MHISSLPGRFGCGDLGEGARAFARFLSGAGFSLWQTLPLSPTDPALGDSPYSSPSAFAGNYLFVSPELLREEGLISREEEERFKTASERRADFGRASSCRKELLRAAWENFREARGRFAEMRADFERFLSEEDFWLADYALFRVLKEENCGRCWARWPRGFAFRDEAALAEFARRRGGEILFVKFAQFLFYRQLSALSDCCARLGVTLFGDMPIYVAWDSADVWANRELFDLNEDGTLRGKAGVPPDYFSKTGQLWGNPLYNWDAMKRDGFRWWRARMSHTLKHCGAVRIDHFRGLCAYWEVPADEETAARGSWRPALGREMLSALRGDVGAAELPLVAEDLGVITDDVRALMEDFALPGMKVLMFAFGGGADNPYLPHNLPRRSVVYTGTHDNDTVRGWWKEGASEAEKKNFTAYTGAEITEENAARAMARMALSSTADTAVIPMQDILGLGSECRMNTPSLKNGSWRWRLLPGELDEAAEIGRLYREMNAIYGRCE